MNKIFLSLMLIISMNLIFAPEGFALSNTEILNKIENSLFGFEYNNEDESTRFNRI